MTERWIKVAGFEGYIVSDAGRVRHQRVNAPILRGSFDKDGYRRVWLRGYVIRVHALVCEAFHGPRPEGFECAHLDGDNKNNRADNLAWVSRSENNRQKALQGRPNGGRSTKLSQAELSLIRASELPIRQIATSFGISASHVSRIRNGLKCAPKGIAQPSTDRTIK